VVGRVSLALACALAAGAIPISAGDSVLGTLAARYPEPATKDASWASGSTYTGAAREAASQVRSHSPTQPTDQTATDGPPAPRGLFALTNRYSSSGSYGWPLLSGCSWAVWVAQCANLTVYGNGTSFDDVGCGPPNGCAFGREFQCDELAQRYAYYAWGEPKTWYGYGGSDGSAAQMWNAAPALPIPLQRFANGAGLPPQQGDLMIFGPGWLGSYWDGSGHVAIVRDVGPGFVDIVEQNATPSGTDHLALHGSQVTANGYTPVTGWIRNTVQAPVSLAVSNVAGMPQTVSEGTGNIDVLWRGTDGRLWTIGYRNSRWAGQATAISPANLATDPTVVSSDPGKADAYWEGIDGNLWHVAYQAGWYGSGAWGTAASLGMGPMQSAPHATAGGGSIDVAWRGAGGSLEVLHAGVAPGATGAVGGVAFGGDPYPVAVGNGQTDVFWRDPGGNLWMEQRMSWGSGSAQELGDGPLGSDPVPVSAGDGNVDVFWHGTDGGLWHVAVASGVGGAPQRVASQGMVGRPTALEETAGAITLVLRRTDGNLATLLQLPGVGWVGPELLGDGPVGSDPSSVSYASGATNVFWRGQNGGLWTSAACPGCSLPPPPPVTTLP